MALLLRCSGISPTQRVEVEELIMDMEGIESVRGGVPGEDSVGGMINSGIPHTNFLITLAVGSATRVGEEVYRGAKEYMLGRLEQWKQARLPLALRQHFVFEFDDNDELVNRWRH